MPKKKTNKAAAKRFKITGGGRVKYTKAGRGHLLAGKTRKRKRSLRSPGLLNPVEAKRVKGMMG